MTKYLYLLLVTLLNFSSHSAPEDFINISDRFQKRGSPVYLECVDYGKSEYKEFFVQRILASDDPFYHKQQEMMKKSHFFMVRLFAGDTMVGALQSTYVPECGTVNIPYVNIRSDHRRKGAMPQKLWKHCSAFIHLPNEGSSNLPSLL